MDGVRLMLSLIGFLLIVRVVYVFSSALHELCHLLCCLTLKCKVKSIKFLFFTYSFDITGKLIIKYNADEKRSCSFLANPKKAKMVAFSGPCGNILLFVIFAILSVNFYADCQNKMFFLSVCICAVELYLTVKNLLPLKRMDDSGNCSFSDGSVIFLKR